MSLMLSLLLVAAPSNANPWVQQGNEDGVKVYTRDVPGSTIREVKAETIIEAPAEAIWAVVNDELHYGEFMPYIVEVKVFGGDAGDAHYEYELIDPPVVSRRDYTLRITLDAKPAEGKYRRSWSAANDAGPAPKENVVRVAVCEGYWEIERLTPKTAKATYWLYTAPGGAVPPWMGNMANNTSVPNLLKALRNRAVNPKWKRT